MSYNIKVIKTHSPLIEGLATDKENYLAGERLGILANIIFRFFVLDILEALEGY